MAPAEDGVVAAYGKLPLSPEYLKHRCYDEPAAGFRLWLDEGYKHAVAQGARHGFALARRWRLLWNSGRGSVAVADVLPSSDGSRPFLFATYSMFAAGSLPVDGAAALSSLAPGWERLGTIADEAVRAADRGAFQACFERATAPRPRGGVIAPFTALAASLGRTDPEELASILWRVRQAVVALRSGAIKWASMPALRLPLGSGPDTVAAAEVWLQWLRHAGLGIDGRQMSVAVPVGGEQAIHRSAWLLLRPMAPSDLLLLGIDPRGALFPDPVPPPHANTQGFGVFQQQVLTYFAGPPPSTPFGLLQ